jgi:hypothetical protein
MMCGKWCSTESDVQKHAFYGMYVFVFITPIFDNEVVYLILQQLAKYMIRGKYTV